MPQTTISDVAEAVVIELNSNTWPIGFTAVPAEVPEYDLTELTMPKVTVVEGAEETQWADRRTLQIDYTIEVGVQLKVDDDPDLLDAVKLTAERIKEHFLAIRRLPSRNSAACIRAVTAPHRAPEHWREYRVLTSIVTLTFREHKALAA